MQNATPPPAENTRYGYKNNEGHRLHVSTVGADRDHVELAIAGVGHLDWRTLNVPAAEVPGIALALLRSAGVTSSPHDCADSLQLALAQLVEHEGIRRSQAAHQELAHRRDHLACDLVGDGAFAYGFADPELQRAIDMIITLQDEAKK